MTTIEQHKRERAKSRIGELKGYYIHLLVFVLVNLFLVLLNYMTSGWEYLWFLFPTLSWGLGLLIHTICVFGMNTFLGKGWEERKIKEFMDNDKTK